MTAAPARPIHDGLFNHFCEFDAGALIDSFHLQGQNPEPALRAALMVQHVRRVLIGTHRHLVESWLVAHFLAAGRRMRMERPVIAPLFSGKPEIRIDGVQMWASPGLTA